MSFLTSLIRRSFSSFLHAYYNVEGNCAGKIKVRGREYEILDYKAEANTYAIYTTHVVNPEKKVVARARFQPVMRFHVSYLKIPPEEEKNAYVLEVRTDHDNLLKTLIGKTTHYLHSLKPGAVLYTELRDSQVERFREAGFRCRWVQLGENPAGSYLGTYRINRMDPPSQ